MKKIFTLFAILFSVINSFAQNVGIGTPTPDASAQLDISANKKGVLIPRMIKADRNLIASPANGLLVFQSGPDSVGFYYYNSGSWIWLQNSTGSGSGWSTTGNTGTDTSVNFIGTKDYMPLRFKFNNQNAGLLSQENTAFGFQAFNSVNNSSLLNTAIGHSALIMFQNGFGNVGLGSHGLGQLKEGNTNIGIGFGSMALHHGDNNILISNTNGAGVIDTFLVDNVIIGNQRTTTGLSLGSDKNVLIGNYAGGSYINGGSNVAIGDSASTSNITGAFNVAIGAKAMANNIRSSGGVVIGYKAAFSDTSINGNVAIGRAALFYNNGKGGNVAIGDSSLFSNNNGTLFPLQSVDNVAVGNHTLFSNTNGFKNTATGSEALYSNVGGYYNLATGFKALNRNTEGYANTAVGTFTLVNNMLGANNVGLGVAALEQNTNGNNNTAIGTYALDNNTSGNDNSAVGFRALRSNSTGSNNSALGDSALNKNTTGYSNVAIGTKALANNVAIYNLVAIGDSALFNCGSTNDGFGKYNTAVGSKALFSLLGYNGNTAIGYNALKQTSGAQNTAIGSFAGTLVNGSANTIIGSYNSLTTGTRNIDGSIFIGPGAGEYEYTSNKLYIENSSNDKNNALIYGDFAADSLNLNAKVNIRDYTRLGTQTSGAPAIKMKKLLIPAGPAVDGVQSYPMGSGITDAKVLGVQIFVTYAAPWKIPASYRDATGFEFNYQVQANNIVIINKAGNSANIGGKPFTVLITYEE